MFLYQSSKYLAHSADLNELYRNLQCYDSLSIFQFSEIDIIVSVIVYSFWRVSYDIISMHRNYHYDMICVSKLKNKSFMHFLIKVFGW